jgi:hypothetical protein
MSYIKLTFIKFLIYKRKEYQLEKIQLFTVSAFKNSKLCM